LSFNTESSTQEAHNPHSASPKIENEVTNLAHFPFPREIPKTKCARLSQHRAIAEYCITNRALKMAWSQASALSSGLDFLSRYWRVYPKVSAVAKATTKSVKLARGDCTVPLMRASEAPHVR
jgi:hypothetical protein